MKLYKGDIVKDRFTGKRYSVMQVLDKEMVVLGTPDAPHVVYTFTIKKCRTRMMVRWILETPKRINSHPMIKYFMSNGQKNQPTREMSERDWNKFSTGQEQ